MMIHPHHRSLASAATDNGSTASEEAATIDSAYRLLVIRGLSAVEAGNVVAYTNGLHPAESGWTVAQIKHLVAIRSMVAGGLIDS
jgi:hypothetical protein